MDFVAFQMLPARPPITSAKPITVSTAAASKFTKASITPCVITSTCATSLMASAIVSAICAYASPCFAPSASSPLNSASAGTRRIAIWLPRPATDVESRDKLSLNSSDARPPASVTTIPYARASSAASRIAFDPPLSSGIISAPDLPKRRSASAVFSAPSS